MSKRDGLAPWYLMLAATIPPPNVLGLPEGGLRS